MRELWIEEKEGKRHRQREKGEIGDYSKEWNIDSIVNSSEQNNHCGKKLSRGLENTVSVLEIFILKKVKY